MKNIKLYKGGLVALAFFLVMSLTSCVAIVEDVDGTKIKDARVLNHHSDEIVLDYTGNITDYDIEVEVYGCNGVKKNGYYIKCKGKYSDFYYGSYGDKKYLIRLNKCLDRDDWVLVRCKKPGKTICAVAYAD